MANRRGTFLSDENVEAMCMMDRPVPMAKVYGLIKNPGVTTRMPQRPKSVAMMLRAISQSTGTPIEELKEIYSLGVSQLPNEQPVYIPPIGNPPQAAKPVATGSGGSITSQQAISAIAKAMSLTSVGSSSGYSQGTSSQVTQGGFPNNLMASISAFSAMDRGGQVNSLKSIERRLTQQGLGPQLQAQGMGWTQFTQGNSGDRMKYWMSMYNLEQQAMAQAAQQSAPPVSQQSSTMTQGTGGASTPP